jgi:hypothetical protein
MLDGTFESSITDRWIAWDARKGLFAILGEHRRHNVCHDIEFRLVRRRQVNENVSGVDSYLAMLRVYDGREGKHTIFLIIYDGVDRGVTNNGQVLSQMTIRLSYASIDESFVALISLTS